MAIVKLQERRQVTLTTRKRKLYEENAKVIKFLRRNPVLACEWVLGIKLMDSQKWILIKAWTTPNVLLCCSRNFGKSFLGSIILLLKAILYENQGIYICSNVGDQAKETFGKIEEIVLRKGKVANSVLDLKDIVEFEVVTSPACQTGFSHAQTGYKVSFYNGSEIRTLNGDENNARGKRASIVLFDEAGFMTDNQIATIEAFATQNSEFKTSTKETFNIKTLRRKCPTQLIYCSSAGSRDSTFYRYYKQFTKEMLSGNRDYFVADMPCEVVLHPYIDGKPSVGLLTQDKIDKAMKANKYKALREYYNIFDTDGSESQMIKWSQIRRCETFSLPTLSNTDGSLYLIAMDPSRTTDNSIITVMRLVKDENLVGKYYGEIVNCINLVSIAKKKNMRCDAPEQVKSLQDTILSYNGNALDYENVYAIGIDSGAGGGGISAYSDSLLADWIGKDGKKHKGFVDLEYKTDNSGILYEGYDRKYPNADTSKLKLISPKKYRDQMCEELVELMNNDLIKFPKEYDGKGFINYTVTNKDGEEEIKTRNLTLEEEEALMGIDLLKYEVTSIHKTEDLATKKVKYALSKEKQAKGEHDDRFYTLIMLAHFLYEIRRKNTVVSEETSFNLSDFFISNGSSNNSAWVESYY